MDNTKDTPKCTHDKTYVAVRHVTGINCGQTL